ncbi:MAG: succinate dehydrogenase cytochrome b subunit [Verrucomicrobiae bacterium]|nr:succinate dehydrogenase cytochrome b subunit [Verrucomicrobiae bacterium]
MNLLVNLFRSSLGRKLVMGATGAGLFGFVVIHMIGNLQVFAGAEVLNQYAILLRTSEELLWGFRLALLAMVGLHLYCAITLTLDNRRARPAGYQDKRPLGATIASRTMMVSGVVVAAFIVFHILHFTTRDIFTDYKAWTIELHGREGHDVYRMVVHGFSIPWVSAAYIVGVGLLCAHLSHGVQSFFQSLGLVSTGYQPIIRAAGVAAALIIFLGMAAVPVSILLKWVS